MKLTSVDGVGVINGFKLLGFVRVHWSAFGIGDIPGDPIMEGFTLGVDGVGGDPEPALKGLTLLTFGFGIGDMLGDPKMEGFTLEDIELLGVEGMGVDPDAAIKGFKLLTFGTGDILGDPSVKEFTLGGIKLLGVEGMGDWDLETVGDILWK